MYFLLPDETYFRVLDLIVVPIPLYEAGDAFFDGDLGGESGVVGELADIGHGVGDIAGLEGFEVEDGFASEIGFEEFDVAEKGGVFGGADIENTIGGVAGGGAARSIP